MSASIDTSQDYIFAAVRAFLLGVLPSGVEVVKANDNSVPMPSGPFVSMMPGRMERLSTNIQQYTDLGTNPGTKGVMTPTKISVQLDFYGAHSQDYAIITGNLFRDDYAIGAFPPDVTPLYAHDPVQMPLVTGEETYLQRWKMDIYLHINPVVSVSQDFFDTAHVDVIATDTL